MSYPPNVRAARWFADECFPRVREVVPDASFVVAGTSPAREISRLAERDGITVTGFVESMAAALNEGSVAVAPMLSGAGIQNKILEAMACGLPVVTTSIGLGGLDAVPGKELVVADGAEAFSDQVAALLRDRGLAEELGGNARRRVLERYTWERAGEDVEQVYADVLRRRAGALRREPGSSSAGP